MRNQMGNNNVSGLQEEEKSSAVEGQEKFTQEVVHEDDVKGETHMVREADEKDFHEIVKELSPDDHHRSRAKDSHIQNETLDVKEKESIEEVPKEDLVAQTAEIDDAKEEQEEDLVCQTTQREDATEYPLEELVAQSDNSQTEGSFKQEQVINEFNHLVESLEVPTESSGEASEINESQTATSSELSSDNEKPLEPNLEGHSFGTSEPRIQQQLSFERETEKIEGSNSVFNANFTSDDDPKADDQHDVVSSQDEPLGEDLSTIVRAGELLELNLLDHNGDKVPLIDNTTAENIDVTVISGTNNQAMEKEVNDAVKKGKASQEDKFLETMSIDGEKLELLWVDEDENGSITREMEPVFFSGLGDKGEKRVDSSQDVSEPQDKSIVLTEESKLMGTESENGEDNCDSSQIQLSELKGDESIAPQPEMVKTGFDCERNGKENAESISSPEIENAYQSEVGTTSSDNNVDSVSMKFEVVKENMPEIRTALTALTVIEPNQKQENSSEGSLGRISTESNEETTSNLQVELRKSPSFDFDLSLGARYEDSDQTPLLCHDKAASRSISSQDVLTFQNTTVKNHYGRDQLPYEAVEVEEKTIRMERSDSDHKPRAPFMNLLKKEGKANAFVELKHEEAPLTEQAIVNSTKGTGKRRPRVSIFSTCICCAASIP